MKKTVINTPKAPAAVGAYSQAIKAEPYIFVSGQLGLDAQTGSFVEGGVAQQTRQALENMKAVLEAAGSSMDKVVKCTVLLDKMEDFKAVNGVYAEFFTENPPARAAYAVEKLPLGGLVEIEAIAMAG